MSSVAADQIAPLADALTDLANVTIAELGRDPSLRADILSFGRTLFRPEGGEQYADVVDLTDKLLALHRSPALDAAARDAHAAVTAVIGEKWASADLEGANGLTVFAPQMLDDDNLAQYRISRFAHETNWDELMAALYNLE